MTHNFPIEQVVFPFPTIPFEPWTHIHTRPHHGDSLVETLRNQRVVHLALRNSSFSLCISGPNELKIDAHEHGSACRVVFFRGSLHG
jgi:hypothetical protein